MEYPKCIVSNRGKNPLVYKGLILSIVNISSLQYETIKYDTVLRL